MLLSSCKDEFLDLDPYTQVTPDAAVKTETDLLNALRGGYAGLRNVNLYGRTIPVIGDLAADNVFISSKNSGRYFAFNNYSITNANADYEGIWNNAYNVILRANNIINSTIPSNANVDQYKGEAYSLRALMYFQLMRSFAKPYTENPSGPGVPLVLSYDPLLKPERSTVKQVYDQILSDLDKAYTLQTQYTGSTRFSKYASRALAAKVSLYMGNNAQALTYANDVIANSGFSLVTATNFNSYWANVAGNPASTKVETLFEVSADATLNAGTDELGYIYSQAGYGDLIANETLYALYSSTDVRKGLITPGPRAGGEASAYIVTKYKAASGDRDDKKVLRMSEVYLIAAEAAQRSGDEVQALTRLNALMAQRDASKVYASIGAQLLEDIITERRKELAFEGDRFYDLNRLQRTIDRVGGIYSLRNIPYSNTFRWGPIPQSERDANPNISQNPGY